MTSAVRIRRDLWSRLLVGERGQEASGVLPTFSVAELRDAVAADLERLLNARCVIDGLAAPLGPQASRSVLSFGVRDFVGRAMSSSEDRRFIARSLSDAIQRHEPRLRQVSVAFQDEVQTNGALMFTIKAVLVIHATKEAVSFDAVLHPVSSSYRVTKAQFSAF